MSEQDDIDNAVLVALNNLPVSVVAGHILNDTMTKPLSTTGAVQVYDKLKAAGFKVVRA